MTRVMAHCSVVVLALALLAFVHIGTVDAVQTDLQTQRTLQAGGNVECLLVWTSLHPAICIHHDWNTSLYPFIPCFMQT